MENMHENPVEHHAPRTDVVTALGSKPLSVSPEKAKEEEAVEAEEELKAEELLLTLTGGATEWGGRPKIETPKYYIESSNPKQEMHLGIGLQHTAKNNGLTTGAGLTYSREITLDRGADQRVSLELEAGPRWALPAGMSIGTGLGLQQDLIHQTTAGVLPMEIADGVTMSLAPEVHRVVPFGTLPTPNAYLSVTLPSKISVEANFGAKFAWDYATKPPEGSISGIRYADGTTVYTNQGPDVPTFQVKPQFGGGLTVTVPIQKIE